MLMPWRENRGVKKPKPRRYLDVSLPRRPRSLRALVPEHHELERLADGLDFEGWEKHKWQPRAFGMEPYSGKRRPNDTYCDAHAGFKPSDVQHVVAWLQRGVRAGLLGKSDDDYGNPTPIWAVSDAGWIFEARITLSLPGKAVYHGYPVLQNDATALPVLARFSGWVQANDPDNLRNCINALEDRYK
jgi:hypothetical protein